MRVQYRLPCKCGQFLLIDRSQAGLILRCQCGAQLEVPTIRGLARLQQVTVADRSTGWGNRQALLSLGLTLAVIGFLIGVYRQAFPPAQPYPPAAIESQLAAATEAIRRASPADTLQLWEQLQKELDSTELPALAQYRARVAENRRWILVMYSLGAIGLVIAAGSFLLPKNI